MRFLRRPTEDIAVFLGSLGFTGRGATFAGDETSERLTGGREIEAIRRVRGRLGGTDVREGGTAGGTDARLGLMGLASEGTSARFGETSRSTTGKLFGEGFVSKRGGMGRGDSFGWVRFKARAVTGDGAFVSRRSKATFLVGEGERLRRLRLTALGSSGALRFLRRTGLRRRERRALRFGGGEDSFLGFLETSRRGFALLRGV